MKKEVDRPKKVKAFSVVCTVLTVIIAIIAGAILINVIIAKVKNRPVSFFGISFSIVETNSMEPEIKTGDLIVFRKCSFKDLKEGDNIVFVADSDFQKEIQGRTIVHRVQEVTSDGLVTKGINNHAADKGVREESEVYGICTSHSTFWGKVFKFLSKFGIIIIIFLIALPFIISQIVKIVRLSKKKDEEKNGGDTNTDESHSQE